MKTVIHRFGFPKFYEFIIYCTLIAILGFIIYFFQGNTDLSKTDLYNEQYSVMIEEEFENMFYLLTD